MGDSGAGAGSSAHGRAQQCSPPTTKGPTPCQILLLLLQLLLMLARDGLVRLVGVLLLLLLLLLRLGVCGGLVGLVGAWEREGMGTLLVL